MQPLLAESDRVLVEERRLQIVEAVLSLNKDGLVQVSLVNRLGITQRLEKGMAVGKAQPVKIISKVDMEVNKCLDTLNAGKGNITSVVNAIDSNIELSASRGVNQKKAKLVD